jgi:hypothetical protein
MSNETIVGETREDFSKSRLPLTRGLSVYLRGGGCALGV